MAWIKLQQTTSATTNSELSPFAPVLSTSYFIGRWFPRVINSKLAMTAISGGQEVRINVENSTKIGAKFFIDPLALTYIPYIAYSIDDAPFVRQAIAPDGSSGEVEVVFNNALSTGKHKVRLILSGVKENTNRWVDGIGLHFLGFTTSNGGIITPYSPRKKLMFVGDSITEGVLILGSNLPSGNAGEKCYTHLTANSLGADPIIVGFGGVGVTKGGGGGVPNAQTNFGYYKDSFPTQAENPSLIVINHGTNDSAATDPDFKTGYQALITAVRAKHPSVKILCMRPFAGTKANMIQEVVNENTNIHYIDTTGWAITYTDGLHPNENGNTVAAQNLVPAITNIVGVNYFN